MRIVDYDLITNIELLFSRPVAIFGAGKRGKEAYSILSRIKAVRIVAFAESDPDIWKKLNGNMNDINGIPICCPKDLIRDYGESLLWVIGAVDDYAKEMFDTLNDFALDEMQVITWGAFHAAMHINIKTLIGDSAFVKKFFLREELSSTKFKSNYHFSVCDELSRGEDILVYQPAKVGSSTICNSLEKVGIKTVHFHTVATYSLGHPGYTPIIQRTYDWWRSSLVERKYKIITLIREPIARSISQFVFQIKDDYVLCDLNENVMESLNNKIIGDAFTGRWGAEFAWFDNELKDVFGIDVFEHDFDKERGFGIIREANADVLVLTLEKINQNTDVIKSFVDDARMDNFELITANDRMQTMWRFFYSDIKKNIVIPQSVIQRYFVENTAVQHFYSREDIVNYRTKYELKNHS